MYAQNLHGIGQQTLDTTSTSTKSCDKELVKKKVIKWLDAGIVYPIFDSKWVNPAKFVPNKEGMTVVRNEKN